MNPFKKFIATLIKPDDSEEKIASLVASYLGQSNLDTCAKESGFKDKEQMVNALLSAGFMLEALKNEKGNYTTSQLIFTLGFVFANMVKGMKMGGVKLEAVEETAVTILRTVIASVPVYYKQEFDARVAELNPLKEADTKKTIH